MGQTVSPMRKIVTLTGLCAALAIAAFGLIHGREQYRVNVLYRTLLADLDPSTQWAVLNQIAQYNSNAATEKLLDIASATEERTATIVWPQVRVEAIRKLHGRGNNDTPELLARLLQPQESLLIKDASANELLSRTCDRHCMDSVLHYLEREHRGEASDETKLTGGVDYVARERTTLHSTLLHIVQKNPYESVEELRDVYGLGTFSPAPFAVALLSEVEVRGVCPHLVRTQSTDKQYSLPQDPLLDKAIAVSGCEHGQVSP
jgi:hypothetical protein